MEFDKKTHKVIISTLAPNEAKAFIKFLESEILRHKVDIREASELINEVKDKFKE